MILFEEFKTLAERAGYADMRVISGAVVMVYPFTPFAEEKKADDPSKNAVVSSYYVASNREKKAVERLIAELKELGIEAREVNDVPHKRKACNAGLGVYGRNQLIFHPKFGSRFKIQTLAIDHDWTESANALGVEITDCDKCETGCQKTGYPQCGECNKCVSACPTGALTGTGFIIEKCIRNHMLLGKVIPEDLREKMGMRLVGCDICQRACPRNSHLDETDMPREYVDALSLQGLLSQGETYKSQLAVLEDLFGVNYARPMRVRVQAVVCAGNSGDKSLLPYLEELRDTPDEAVKTHVEWAIERLSR